MHAVSNKIGEGFAMRKVQECLVLLKGVPKEKLAQTQTNMP
jgi:hypothetical protein